MKKIILLLIVIVFMSGCQTIKKDIKHWKSGWVGLKRHITLYSASGTVIREWHTDTMVEMSGSVASWIQNGKEIKIAGTYVIEED